jgi:hypothetical protein
LDITQRDKKYVVTGDLHEGVWLTGVIDIVSAVATTTAVETPAIV